MVFKIFLSTGYFSGCTQKESIPKTKFRAINLFRSLIISCKEYYNFFKVGCTNRDKR